MGATSKRDPKRVLGESLDNFVLPTAPALVDEGLMRAFPARRLAIIFGFVFGVVLWLLARPTRLLLDATASILRIRAPRPPFSTTTITVPLDDVVALDIEVPPRASRSKGVTLDGYQFSWRFGSNERIPINRGRFVVGGYDQQRAAVNACLEERV